MSESLARTRSDSPMLVVDSWPVMEWLKNRQPTADRFLRLLEDARNPGLMLHLSNINFGEIYYSCWKEGGQFRADEIRATFRDLPIRMAHPSAEDILSAARIKARYPIAYADAFAASLALKIDCPVLTGDPEFLQLERDGLVRVEWIGA